MYKQLSFIALSLWIASCQSDLNSITQSSTATANNSYQGFGVENLTDSLPDTYWNSGQKGENWVNFNFKQPVNLKKIQFEITVSPASDVTYEILTKKQGEDYKLVNSNSKQITSNDTVNLEENFNDVSDVKIKLNDTSSWMCINFVNLYEK